MRKCDLRVDVAPAGVHRPEEYSDVFKRFYHCHDAVLYVHDVTKRAYEEGEEA